MPLLDRPAFLAALVALILKVQRRGEMSCELTRIMCAILYPQPLRMAQPLIKGLVVVLSLFRNSSFLRALLVLVAQCNLTQ